MSVVERNQFLKQLNGDKREYLIPAATLFVKAGLAGSGKEAKRLIAEGGARMNDAALSDAGLMVTAADLAQPIKLSAGKKRHALVVLAG